MSEMAASGTAQQWWPRFDMSDPRSIEIKDYQEWFENYGSLPGLNITGCDLEREMNKVRTCNREIQEKLYEYKSHNSLNVLFSRQTLKAFNRFRLQHYAQYYSVSPTFIHLLTNIGLLLYLPALTHSLSATLLSAV